MDAREQGRSFVLAYQAGDNPFPERLHDARHGCYRVTGDLVTE